MGLLDTLVTRREAGPGCWSGGWAARRSLTGRAHVLTRAIRPELAWAYYHTTSRGVARQDIFLQGDLGSDRVLRSKQDRAQR